MAGSSNEPGTPTIYRDVDKRKGGDSYLLCSKLQTLSTLPFSEVTDPARISLRCFSQLLGFITALDKVPNDLTGPPDSGLVFILVLLGNSSLSR